ADIFEPGRLQFVMDVAWRRDERSLPPRRRPADERAAVEPGPGTARGLVHFVARRRIYHAGNRGPVLDDRKADRPGRLALDEGARPVDRIDDEYAPAQQAFGRVGRLFAEPAILGARRGQRRMEELVEDDVGFRDRGVELLRPGLELASEVAAGDDPRGDGGRAEQLEIFGGAGGESHRFVRQGWRPSRPTICAKQGSRQGANRDQ